MKIKLTYENSGLYLVCIILYALITFTILSDHSYISIIIIGVFFGIAVIIKLDTKSWLLIPIAILLENNLISFGPRSFENAELVVPFILANYLMRLFLNKENFRLLKFCNLGLLLYFFWVLMVFIMNPVGFEAFGAVKVGARAYFKFLLGFVSFLIISNQNIDEDECRYLIRIILAASILNFFFSAKNLLDYYGTDGFYTWHQALMGPSLFISLFIFSRYSLNDLFNKHLLKYFLIYLLMVIFALYSGKRAGLVSILAIPIISSFLNRKYRLAIYTSIFVFLFFAVLTIGHSSLFNLPKNVQRAIAFAPGNWDRDVMHMTRGIYRKTMAENAIEKIKSNILFGRKGVGYELNESSYINYGTYGFAKNIAISALAGNWHNTWLGIAADFGIPASLWWLIFSLQRIYYSKIQANKSIKNSNMHTICLMLLIYSITDLLTSWVGGDSLFMPYKRLWMYGVIIGIHNSHRIVPPHKNFEVYLSNT